MLKRMKQPTAAEVETHLPLRPVACTVMAALADGPRVGVEILEAINATTRGGTLAGPGTLYRLLRDLRQEGLIIRADPPHGVTDDRHSPHALTPLGAAVLEADLDRLKRTIHMAARLRRA